MSNLNLVWVADHQLAWVKTPASHSQRIKVRFLLSEYKGSRLKTAIKEFGGRLESNSHGVLWASFEVPANKRPSQHRAYILEKVDFFAHNR